MWKRICGQIFVSALVYLSFQDLIYPWSVLKGFNLTIIAFYGTLIAWRSLLLFQWNSCSINIHCFRKCIIVWNAANFENTVKFSMPCKTEPCDYVMRGKKTIRIYDFIFFSIGQFLCLLNLQGSEARLPY